MVKYPTVYLGSGKTGLKVHRHQPSYLKNEQTNLCTPNAEYPGRQEDTQLSLSILKMDLNF